MRLLEQVYGAEGAQLAELMRQLLPLAVGTVGPAADEARRALQVAADKASVRLSQGSSKWLRGKDIQTAIAIGQKQALGSLRSQGVRTRLQFGGVNTRLLGRLTQEISRDLAVASASPPAFVRRAITKSQVAVERLGGPVGVDLRLTSILARGVLQQQTTVQMRRAILESVGLQRGDRILLLNGRSFEASSYAETVVRTRLSEANNDAKAEELQSRGYNFIEISAHNGVDPDDICYLMQGKVWAFAPNNYGIPVIHQGVGIPPFHPRCVHTFGAWVPELRTRGERSSALSQHRNTPKLLEAFRGADGQMRSYKLAA